MFSSEKADGSNREGKMSDPERQCSGGSCTRGGGFSVQVVHLTFDVYRDPSLGRKRGHGQSRRASRMYRRQMRELTSLSENERWSQLRVTGQTEMGGMRRAGKWHELGLLSSARTP